MDILQNRDDLGFPVCIGEATTEASKKVQHKQITIILLYRVVTQYWIFLLYPK